MGFERGLKVSRQHLSHKDLISMLFLSCVMSSTDPISIRVETCGVVGTGVKSLLVAIKWDGLYERNFYWGGGGES